jgi:hypothetical protein
MFRGLTRYFGRLGSPYPELIPNLEHIYLQYQEAQATGDAQSVQALSMGQASKRGLRVARAIRKGKSKWELVKTNAKPKLLMVRAGAMDASGTGDMAVQVVVRFDTLQRLTLAGKVNEVRVVENVVFDKREGGVNTFRIKDTLPFMQPEFLQKSS